MESNCLPSSDSILNFLAAIPSNRSAKAAIKINSKLNRKFPSMAKIIAKPPKDKFVKVMTFAVWDLSFLIVESKTSNKNILAPPLLFNKPEENFIILVNLLYLILSFLNSFVKSIFTLFGGHVMLKQVYRLMIELTNGKWTSVILQRFARSRISRFVVPSFAKIYELNQDEMEKTLHEYPTLHDLFIRTLKKEVRIVDKNNDSVVSPVDAVIEDVGSINQTSEMVVKGKSYSIQEMLGNQETATRYLNGTYMVLYLSPSHYHRIHSPITGTIVKQWTLGSKSYPVNKMGLKYGVRTLAKNYRMITEVNTASGHIAIVKVGAMFVNSIEKTHKGMTLQKGEEMAYFSFGSTIVLLFEKGIFQLDPSIHTPKDIRIGEKIGVMVKENGGV